MHSVQIVIVIKKFHFEFRFHVLALQQRLVVLIYRAVTGAVELTAFQRQFSEVYTHGRFWNEGEIEINGEEEACVVLEAKVWMLRVPSKTGVYEVNKNYSRDFPEFLIFGENCRVPFLAIFTADYSDRASLDGQQDIKFSFIRLLGQTMAQLRGILSHRIHRQFQNLEVERRRQQFSMALPCASCVSTNSKLLSVQNADSDNIEKVYIIQR